MKWKTFWKTVTWQSFAFGLTMVVGKVYYGNWSITPVAVFLVFVLPPLFYVHERIWERKNLNQSKEPKKKRKRNLR